MKHLFPDEINQAASLLKQGIPVAFPTETVYGLGAPVTCVEGIHRIFQMKRRPLDNPLICHIASMDQLSLLVRQIPSQALILARHFWPGSLTLVLKKQQSIPNCVTAGLDTIAVRMPRHPVALNLIRQVAEPLAAPSANRSGKPSSTTAQHVLNDFKGEDGAVIDGGRTEEGLESTVVFIAEGQPRVLRPGCITSAQIAQVLKCDVDIAQADEQRSSPGTRYRHYAPKAALTIVRPWEIRAWNGCDFISKKGCFLMSTQPQTGFHLLTAANLYALLRQADDEGSEEIVVFCTQAGWDQLALRDRLLRAAGTMPNVSRDDQVIVG